MAQARRQTAEEQDRALQAADAAEQTRARLIKDKAKNDLAEMQAAIAEEETRASLIQAKVESDQAEIERRQTLKRANINPDALSPCQIKRRYLILLMVTIGLFIIAIAIRIYFSK